MDQTKSHFRWINTSCFGKYFLIAWKTWNTHNFQMNRENDRAYLRHIESHQYWRLQYFGPVCTFYRLALESREARLDLRVGGWVGGGPVTILQICQIYHSTTTQTIHNLWHLWAWFGGFRGRFTGKLFYFSSSAGQAEKSIQRCGRLKALIRRPTKLSQKVVESEKVEFD